MIVANVSDIQYGSALANARLIAAAPDLLAALRAVLDLLDVDMLDDATHTSEELAVITAARAAIAKAEGRSTT